uniref:Ionotropic glutamate receptor C-terminal domain-containing protein n=1 Tax=Strigamia maritima TaxID=126957 RepID=T1JPK0_STRMM
MEFHYVGYKWLRIDDGKIEENRSYLQLTCDNQSYPPSILLSYVNNSWTVGGYFGEVFSIFNGTFNISFEIIPCKDGQFGAFINGSWTGTIGDLTLGDVSDIAPSAAVTRQKSDYVKFSSHFYTKQLDIIYRKSDQHEWNYSFYLQPFNMEMWFSILAINLIFIFVKVFLDYVSRKKVFGSCILNLINELLLCWPIFLQGNLNNFSLKSMKLLFGIYIIFSMLLLISYNSMLTSLFSTTKLKIPFSSLDDMFENTGILPVILKGAMAEDIFLKPPYENKTVFRVSTLVEGIDQAYSGKFAFIHVFRDLQHLMDRNCSLDALPYYIFRLDIALAYSKQFDYTDYFNSKILLLKQYGILSVQFKRIFPGVTFCSENSFNPISFGQIIGLFIFIIIAILISLIFGIIEIISEKCFTTFT